MTKVKLTNVLIWLLVCLAVYQTILLWITNLSNKNIFDSIVNYKKEQTEEHLYAMESLFINVGDGKFLKKYTSMSFTDYKLIFDDTISNALNSAKTEGVLYKENYDFSDILNNKSVIYLYDFFIQTKDMQEVFNMKPISTIEQYNMITILPIDDENIKVIFINSAIGEAYEIFMNKNSIGYEIMNVINELASVSNRDYYYVKNDTNFNQNFSITDLFPISDDGIFSVENIISQNPLEKAGGILLTESEKYINIFFENPAIKTSSFINDTYTYNDENVVVKYYTNGVLEYTNYKKNLSQSQDSCYKIAIDFLKSDINLQNEFYLQDYKSDGDKTTFYFNYKINNFPIAMSEDMKQTTQMNSIIEIEIENGIVYKYKKLIYDFYTLDKVTIVDETLEQYLLADNVDSSGSIGSVDLRYIMENAGQEIDIQLYLNSDNYVDLLNVT